MRQESHNLDERIRAYYRSRSLDDQRLQRLRAVCAGDGGGRLTGLRRLWPRVLKLAAAAALLLAIGVAYYSGWNIPPARVLAEKAAEEIALNHAKQLPLEVRAETFDALRVMTKLDFTPVEPALLKAIPYRLAGARYCSVGGQIAVQIRVMTDEGQLLTLYQFLPGETYARLEKSEGFDIEGVWVEVWQEEGLVMGLARMSADLH